jgi:hypothetical protein
MPVFDDIVPPKLVWPVEARWPLRRAEALIARFRARFPSIYYDIYWETRLMNAREGAISSALWRAGTSP